MKVYINRIKNDISAIGEFNEQEYNALQLEAKELLEMV